MDVVNCIEKAGRQLNKKEPYRQISKDQTAANNKAVKNVIERFQKKNLMTKNVVF